MYYQQKTMTESEYIDFLKVASGEKKAELVLKNVSYLDVFTNCFRKADIAISHKSFAGIGNYSGEKEIDMTGKTVVPGFIDAHIHIESTTVVPETFAKEALKHGTTTILTDPHEIANVMGIDGIRYMLEATKNLPMDIFFMIPSCVPSCEFDEAGAHLEVDDMKEFFQHKSVLGIAELMDVNGVVDKNRKILAKTFEAIKNNKLIDGHAPFVSDKSLMGYIAAGVLSDHECSNFDEAVEKIRASLWIMIREGTAGKNLEGLIKLCQEPYASRCMFCTDDRHINDIIDEGHIDHIIRKAISLGADPATVYKMASTNAGKYLGMSDRTAIAPGFLADFVVLDDVEKVVINSVYKAGTQLTDSYLEKNCKSNIDSKLNELAHNSVHIDEITERMLENTDEKYIIGLVDGQLLTTNEGKARNVDTAKDILKVCVVERHKNTGHIGIGFLKGYGLKKGAIATTVAHDAHNIIAVGADEKEMAAAINKLKEMGGGMIVYADGEVKASYALPVAGLMSEVSAEEAKKKLKEIHEAAYQLGVNKGIDPFMTLSFAALPVIPELRITTFGVVNVTKWKIED